VVSLANVTKNKQEIQLLLRDRASAAHYIGGLSSVGQMQLFEIFTFTKYDLETRVIGNSNSLELTPFDRSYM